MIEGGLKKTDQEEFRIFLTSTDSSLNFRTQIHPQYKKNRSLKCKRCNVNKLSKDSYIDTIRTTKGKMKRRYFNCLECNEPVADSKPVYYQDIRAYLIKRFNAKVVKWGEADDWLGIHLKEGEDWIATHDKDLKMLPQNYYNLKSHEKYLASRAYFAGTLSIDEKRKIDGAGFKWFCAQMLLGDTVDNIIKPYKGDGPVFVYKLLAPLTTIRECWNMIELYYRLTSNSDILWTMAQLLWIARKPRQIFTKEVLNELIEEEECDIQF